MKKEIEKWFEQQLKNAKSTSFEEHSKLPSEEEIKMPPELSKKKWDCGIYREHEGEKLKIVLQLYQHGFLGIGKMSVAGFSINSAGEIADLGIEDLYDYT